MAFPIPTLLESKMNPLSNAFGLSHLRYGRGFCALLLSLLLLGKTAAGGENWWQFRGPSGDGHVAAKALPTAWSDTKNVAWKTKIHDRGWSSPVVWGNQIWITTATRDGRKLFAVCVDLKTGQIVHDVQVFDVESPMRITGENTYATPTPVVQEGRVFVHYGTYGTACLDTLSGRVLWSRRDLRCDHEVGAGPASSPTLIGGNLVVHVDGRDVQYIVALDQETGKTVWKTNRSLDFSEIPVHHRKAFCMPFEFETKSGRQFVSPGGHAVYGYDASGREIWRVQHRGFSVAPRPVYGKGLVFTLIDRDDPELWAIRPDGRGDVTDTHVVWRVTKSMPQRCSPLLANGFLFLISRDGIATCIEPETGVEVWKQRFAGKYSASPIFVNGLVYAFNEDASATIYKASADFSLVAENALAHQTMCASPAVAGDSLIVRTENYLYRIESGAMRTPDPSEMAISTHNPFVGDWDIGRSAKTGKPTFIMSLRPDFTAKKSHVPNASGKWELVKGEARVIWSDGWRDIIRKEGDGYRKIAFRPGTDFDSPPTNQDTAERSAP